MSHEVETMFSARLTPWHQLGTVTADNLTAREALVTAGLDWQVEKQPLYALTNEGFKEVETHVATVRDSDASILGVVGSGYEPIQNDTMLEWTESLIDSGDANFTTAGSLREGRVVFSVLELDKEIVLPGNDVIKPYLVTASSHDSSLAFKAFTSPTRVVCMNTLRMAQANTISSWTIRHTVSADMRLEAARRVLGLTIGYYDEFAKEAHALIEQELASADYNSLIKAVLPQQKETTTRQRDHVIRQRNKVHRIYRSGSIGQFKGTGWGALNAVNEYELYGKAVKGNRAERHALRSLNADFPLTDKTRKLLAV